MTDAPGTIRLDRKRRHHGFVRQLNMAFQANRIGRRSGGELADHRELCFVGGDERERHLVARLVRVRQRALRILARRRHRNNGPEDEHRLHSGRSSSRREGRRRPALGTAPVCPGPACGPFVYDYESRGTCGAYNEAEFVGLTQKGMYDYDAITGQLAAVYTVTGTMAPSCYEGPPGGIPTCDLPAAAGGRG